MTTKSVFVLCVVLPSLLIMGCPDDGTPVTAAFDAGVSASDGAVGDAASGTTNDEASTPALPAGGFISLIVQPNGANATWTGEAEVLEGTTPASRAAAETYVKQTIDAKTRAYVSEGQCALRPKPADDPPGLPLPLDVGPTVSVTRADDANAILLSMNKGATDARYRGAATVPAFCGGIRFEWGFGPAKWHGILAPTSEVPCAQTLPAAKLVRGGDTVYSFQKPFPADASVTMEFGNGRVVCKATAADAAAGKITINATGSQLIENSAGASGNFELLASTILGAAFTAAQFSATIYTTNTMRQSGSYSY